MTLFSESEPTEERLPLTPLTGLYAAKLASRFTGAAAKALVTSSPATPTAIRIGLFMFVSLCS
jgi:hypothetical protein